MAERSLIFPVSEFRRRTAALQATMARARIDALLLTTPADIYYVTGFLTRFWESPARSWFVVLPGEGPPIAVIPEIGSHLMRQTWVDDIRTWPAPRPEDEGVSLVTDALLSCAGPNARIGLAMGAETALRMPLADYERLSEALAPRGFVDATAVIRGVRAIKSPAEQAQIAKACAVACGVFDALPDWVTAGLPLDRVFRGFQARLLEAGADWVAYVAGGAGQAGYRDVISPADATPLAEGDVLMLDTGAVVNGYFCDFNRNYVIGQASEPVCRAQAALYAATTSALSDIRPGMMAEDAHRIMARTLAARGARPTGGRFGHGLGLTLTEWPSLQPGDTTILQPGMVITLEPCAETTDGRMLVHEEVVVMTDAGLRLLTDRAPETLPRLRS